MIDPEKCCMTRFPAPVLAEKAKPIEAIDDSIRRLAARMIDLMVEYKGVGLAGPQAGVNLRIFVASPDGTRENTKVYINPEIEPSGPLEAVEEGCLSLPGLYAKIRRYTQCTITATDLDGNRFTETAEGLLARAFQHEFDHIEGTLIKDRFTRIQQIAARRRLREMMEEYEEPST
jgi:peptide deformylase